MNANELKNDVAITVDDIFDKYVEAMQATIDGFERALSSDVCCSESR